MEKNNKNVKLNLLKGIGCMGVVFIHVSFPGKIGNIIGLLSAYAVPVFLMIAGYYSYGKGTDVVKRRLIRHVKILLYGYTVSFIYGVINASLKNELVQWFRVNFNWKTPLKYIVFCMVDFAGPLWYLIAVIELYIVWYFIVKKQKEVIILKLIPVLFVFQISLEVICEKMGLWWMWRTNFVSQAMPWFMLGYYMHTKKAEKLKKLPPYKLLFIVAMGCVVLVMPGILEMSWLGINRIGYIPYAVGLFAWALKEREDSVCKPIEYIGENLTMHIYIFHNIVSGVITIICSRVLGIRITGDKWLWYKPIIVLICTIIISQIIYITLSGVKRRKKNSIHHDKR